MGSESLERPMPLSELEPLARIISSVEHQRFPVAVRGVSPSMLRLLGVERIDEGHFVVQQGGSEDLYLEVFRQAHQDLLGKIEIVALVECSLRGLEQRQNIVAATYLLWSCGLPYDHISETLVCLVSKTGSIASVLIIFLFSSFFCFRQFSCV